MGELRMFTLRFEISQNDGDNSRVNLVDSHYRVYRDRDGKLRQLGDSVFEHFTSVFHRVARSPRVCLMIRQDIMGTGK
ncbi:hypothetical protein DBV15_07243 [Temnothorax longispinosus]|uniref:Uncharacterized protein n=1 Tax=Temnothorax longispinosus TaxID=300112 RepID=A0A4S2JJZ0_9HYME|nr:hypothetical protein DBV15_07243 [Temnothorax longispinosus]